MSRQTLKRLAVDVLIYLLGGLLYAASTSCFIAPNHIAPGGVTGIAIILNYLWDFRIGLTMLALNIPLFLLGYLRLGKSFVGKTIVASTIMSLAVDLVERFLPAYTGDRLLAAIYGGLLAGAGVALIFLRGATSGGTDIAAKLLQKRAPHLSMGRLIMLVDGLVIAAAGVVFGSVESCLYALVVQFVSSSVIDRLLSGSRNGRILLVVTTRGEEMTQEIHQTLHRGVTLLPAKGGYTKEGRDTLLCGVRRHEVARLRKLIFQVDDHAFIMETEAGEIIGEGFNTMEK